MSDSRRHGNPVVTGITALSPNGLSTEAYWAATLAGRSGIGPISRFDASRYPVRLAGEIHDFGTTEHVPSRLVVQTDLWTHLGLAGTALTLKDAAFDPLAMDPYDLAVITASSSGGNEFGQREIQSLWSRGPEHVTAYQSIAWFYAASTGQISIRHGLKGPCGVLVSEQAGALDAVGQARRALRRDSLAVITGGTEAPLSPYALTCQIAGGRLTRRTDPAHAYIPFDTAADGHLPGEGGAILLLEDAGSARRRGAPQVYGEVAGYASGFDPAPGSERPPVLRGVIERALADASVPAGDIDVVFADAAGLPELDRQEADALAAVFGPAGVPVTAPKTMTGRLYAGGAALDLAAALLSIRDSVIPPTVGVRDPDPAYRLDLVLDAPRERPVRAALVVARGYGGFTSAVVVRAVPDQG